MAVKSGFRNFQIVPAHAPQLSGIWGMVQAFMQSPLQGMAVFFRLPFCVDGIRL
jgi:hypothetical protein